MATFKWFEDIEAWQKARELCNKIHVLTIKPLFAKDFGLIKQIKESSGAVMDNIAEGFDREGQNEFLQFLPYPRSLVAKPSLNCTGHWIQHLSQRMSLNNHMLLLKIPKLK